MESLFVLALLKYALDPQVFHTWRLIWNMRLAQMNDNNSIV